MAINSARRLCIIFTLAAMVFACTDDVSVKMPGNDAGNDTASNNTQITDAAEDAARVDDTSAEDANGADAANDTASDALNDTAIGGTSLDLCLLGSDPPTSPNCIGADKLDFGWIPIKSSAERRFRLENTGEARIWIMSITVPIDESDVEIETLAYKLEIDPNNPNRRIRVPETVPARINAGETLFVDVTVKAGVLTGALPADSVLIEADVNLDDLVELIVPFVGEIGHCATGTGSCDGSAATGCETDTSNNDAHCGGCGLVCELANVDARCVEGGCQMNGQCIPGFANCDKSVASGCESNVLSDDANCGSCGRNCARANADTGCNGTGDCDFACHTGFDDCNRDLALDLSDGCEVNIHTSPTQCGSCGFICNLPNAYPGCALGNCFVDSCMGDYGNCDGQTTNGCEINLANDVNNCNACNNKCSFPNASAKCEGRGCAIDTCFTDYANCTEAPGCETNTSVNVDHCGGCGLACDLANATPRCTGSNCLIDSCDPGFANCDSNHANGCEANTNTSLAHCGGCNLGCSVPNAVAQCQAPGGCSFVECLPGWIDLDGVNGPGTNGCEYACTPSAGEDHPYDTTQFDYASANRDTNCDGIDGDASRAFFVATNGDDTFSGTRQFPLRNVQTAIDRASNTSGINQVYVSNGTYSGQITLRPGVFVYGGYSRDNNWRRSASYTSAIENNSFETNRNVIAMQGSSITGAARTIVQNLTIRSGGANSLLLNTDQGASSYGVHCVNCPSLTMIGNDITAGAGASGKLGANSTTVGPGGTAGGNGGNGDHDGSTRGSRGSAGTSLCNDGGSGGLGGSRGNNYGENGFTGSVNTPGGPGGAGGNPGKKGGDGTGGSGGSLGPAGPGGNNTGALTNNFWRGNDGSAGGRGFHANGGGGGGGGGGQGCTFCINGTGNGGGGGGGAGCGGYGGSGGGAGGGSIGMVLINSDGVVISRNTIRTGQGGPGGAGGAGSSGGIGGNGGAGASVHTGEIGAGGNGGNGGNGGSGGYGGGGAGGPSLPMVVRTTALTSPTTTNTLNPGTGGAGGQSQGTNGNTGIALQIYYP
ncbi:MAG: hypothetical protein H0U74_11780 [Bradymonadaceae bacterium]|nr:hypothetical protein [Lujinxingiaceae bacterium]